MYVYAQPFNCCLNLHLLQTGGKYQSLKFMQLPKCFSLNLNLNKAKQSKRKNKQSVLLKWSTQGIAVTSVKCQELEEVSSISLFIQLLVIHIFILKTYPKSLCFFLFSLYFPSPRYHHFSFTLKVLPSRYSYSRNCLTVIYFSWAIQIFWKINPLEPVSPLFNFLFIRFSLHLEKEIWTLPYDL